MAISCNDYTSLPDYGIYYTLCLCVYTNPLEEEETLFLVPHVVTFDLTIKETKRINNIKKKIQLEL